MQAYPTRSTWRFLAAANTTGVVALIAGFSKAFSQKQGGGRHPPSMSSLFDVAEPSRVYNEAPSWSSFPSPTIVYNFYLTEASTSKPFSSFLNLDRHVRPRHSPSYRSCRQLSRHARYPVCSPGLLHRPRSGCHQLVDLQLPARGRRSICGR